MQQYRDDQRNVEVPYSKWNTVLECGISNHVGVTDVGIELSPLQVAPKGEEITTI
jgi:hypothetical protein